MNPASADEGEWISIESPPAKTITIQPPPKTTTTTTRSRSRSDERAAETETDEKVSFLSSGAVEEMAPRELTRFRSLRKLTSSSTYANFFQLPSRNVCRGILFFFLKFLVKLYKLNLFLIVIFFAAWFYGGILPYLVTVLAMLSLGYQLSDTFLYQPDMPPESRLFIPTPVTVSLPFESVEIVTKDRIKLQAFLIKQQKSNPRSVPVFIYFHGNAGNIGHRLDNVKMLYNKINCNFLMVEYRGYGASEGVPSEQGFYLDSQAAFDFVQDREDLDSSQIILFGRSLGGAVAIDLASKIDYRDRVKALIVENTFTSIPDLARVIFPVKLMKFIPNFCFKNRFESYQKISNVICPILFICGSKDELIPNQMSTELYLRCTAPLKKLKKFPNGGHNDTWVSHDYSKQLAIFIQEVNEYQVSGLGPSSSTPQSQTNDIHLQQFNNDNIV